MKSLIVADVEIPFIKEMYGSIAELRLVNGDSFTSKTVRDADILIVRSITRIDKDVLEGSRVRFVGTVTSGHDHIDLNYLASRAIRFADAAGCNSNAVAEYVISAILVLHKRLKLDLHRTALGVVGVGNVGSKVVKKASALGMRVLLNDPPLERKSGSLIYTSLDDVMEADIITLHVPLTYNGDDPTYHLFNEDRIGVMKPGSILINTSRGPVVKNDALKNALRSGHLRTSVIDVWENEPEIDGEILSMAAIGTPHIAGYSIEGKTNGAYMIYNAVIDHMHEKKNWDLKGKLSPLDVSRIRIDNPDRSCQDILADIVKKCYDIEDDDARLRSILNAEPEERKFFFNKLRSDYPVRREFASTTVEIQTSNPELSQCFERIGFSIGKI